MSRRLRAADVYRIAHYTRNQFRGLLAELDYRFEDEAQTHPRVARTFSSLDFLVILVACELDSRIGLKRSVIAALLPSIAAELSGPRPVASRPKLILTFDPPAARYVDHDVAIEQGIALPLASIFARADGRLEEAGTSFPTVQAALNLGPTLIERNERNEERVRLQSSDARANRRAVR